MFDKKFQLTFAKIWGIPCKLSVSSLFLFFVIGSSYGTIWLWPMVLMIFSVLLHEFGHALAAGYFGIKVRDITVYWFGMAAHIEDMPTEPIKEFVIAICGPLVNILIAGLLGAMLSILKTPSYDDLIHHCIALQVILIVFNLTPIYPMDGGRLLRSLLFYSIQDFEKACHWTKIISTIVAIMGSICLFSCGNIIMPFVLVFMLFLGFCELEQQVRVFKLKSLMEIQKCQEQQIKS